MRLFDQFLTSLSRQPLNLFSPTLQMVRRRFRSNRIGRNQWFFGPPYHDIYPLQVTSKWNFLTQNPCNFWKSRILPYSSAQKNQCSAKQKTGMDNWEKWQGKIWAEKIERIKNRMEMKIQLENLDVHHLTRQLKRKRWWWKNCDIGKMERTKRDKLERKEYEKERKLKDVKMIHGVSQRWRHPMIWVKWKCIIIVWVPAWGNGLWWSQETQPPARGYHWRRRVLHPALPRVPCRWYSRHTWWHPYCAR